MRVGIEAMSGETDVGDIGRTWEVWVDGKGMEKRAELKAAERWREWTSRCMERLLQETTAAERDRFGFVLATTKGDLEGGLAGTATLGSEAGRMASAFGLKAGAWAVSTACSSGLVALIDAGMAVRGGEAEKIVAMGADVAWDFVRDGFRSLKALSVKGCRPFDVGRDGLMLGSAVAGCVIGKKPGASSQKPEGKWCEILGWGVSNDATHMTAPDREAGGLVRAMRGALEMAGIGPGDVDVVLAHGTGTVYNDAMEAVAIEKVFLCEAKGGTRPAVTGVKGLIGHTLGASGMVEAMLAARMIETGRVPRMWGLHEAERKDLDLVMETREMRVRRVMKVASGFGGMNAAVIMGEARS